MKRWLFWLLIAQGADMGSTAWALAHGCQEGNPILRNHPHIGYTLKVGLTGLTIWRAPQQARQHPTLTRWEVAIPAVSGTAAAVWNLSTRCGQ